MNLLYLLILYGNQYLNFACIIVPQISCIIQKIKKSIMAKVFLSRKQHFRNLKVFGSIELFKDFA